MRLDHLLSREQAKPGRAKPTRGRSGCQGIGIRQRKSEWKTLEDARASKSGRDCLRKRSLSCIVFRDCEIPVAPAHEVRRCGTHLENCTPKERHLVKQPVAKRDFAVGLRENPRRESAEDDQDTKGTGWMPWHWTPKKDVVSCEKPRGAASRL